MTGPEGNCSGTGNMGMQHVDCGILQHVSAGCNRVAGGLSWGRYIAFAAHNAIMLYDVKSYRIVGTLLGHKDYVNCVQWLWRSKESESEWKDVLISGGADGAVLVWLVHKSLAHQKPSWELIARLENHTAPISSVAVWNHHYDCIENKHTRNGIPDCAQENVVILVSTAGDGDVIIWQSKWKSSIEEGLDQASWTLIQRMQFGTRMQHCAALVGLANSSETHSKSFGAESQESIPSSTNISNDVLLALGGVDGLVRLFIWRSCRTSSESDQKNDSGNKNDLGYFHRICELVGHQNWIRGLDFTYHGEKLLLASASQDRCIRIWAISPLSTTAGDSDDSLNSLTRFATKPRFIDSLNRMHQASLEALLIGHEDWVHSVAWKPSKQAERNRNDDLHNSYSQSSPCLLSASMDRTMSLWVPDKSSGIWYAKESVGDAGVNHLGYFTGVWSPEGEGVAAHGFTGALHLWNRDEEGGLRPQPASTGHYGPIVDACWAANGSCLLTVSTDQTARITAEVLLEPEKKTGTTIWREIARPQVHGHDFSSVAAFPCINKDSMAFKYASGSEEKMIRIFEAPDAFMATLGMSCGEKIDVKILTTVNKSAYGATLPALGLSNKAVYEESTSVENERTVTSSTGGMFDTDGSDFAPACAPSAVAGAALEEHLAQNTLWPEIHKLYGHGNDIFSLAADPQSQYLASACKAQTASLAKIFIWDVSKWAICPGGELEAHSLTVTQLCFSPDGNLLASASRDRSFAIFKRTNSGDCSSHDLADMPNQSQPPFSLASKINKAHARVLWGLAWTPDSNMLLSASRDHSVKIWLINAGTGAVDEASALQVKLGDSVRSLAVSSFISSTVKLKAYSENANLQASREPNRRCLVAAGLEEGDIVVSELSWNISNTEDEYGRRNICPESLKWTELWKSDNNARHAAAVRKLCWRSIESTEREFSSIAAGKYHQQLASCGDDHAIRIFEF